MKLSELFSEGEIIPFKGKGKASIFGTAGGFAHPDKTPVKPVHDDVGDFDWESVLKDDPEYNKPGRKNQDEIDDMIYQYRNLGVGSQILFNNRLAQIIKVPDEDRFIIKFDDTGEKKIIGKRDDALHLIPSEHLSME